MVNSPEKNDEHDKHEQLTHEIINVTIIIQLIMATKSVMVLPSMPAKPKTLRSPTGSVKRVNVFDLAIKIILKTLHHEHLAMEIQTKKNPSVSSNLRWSKRERKVLSNMYLI